MNKCPIHYTQFSLSQLRMFTAVSVNVTSFILLLTYIESHNKRNMTTLGNFDNTHKGPLVVPPCPYHEVSKT